MDGKTSPQKPERMFNVYRHNQNRQTLPCLVIDRATADYWIACNWVSRFGRWSLILKKPLPLKLRDTSCSIRESTIMAAASGSKYHLSLIQEAWG